MTELDYGVGNVTAELVRQGMWENSVIFMVADNGAQMDHGKNWPLRGGKHTFWDGGVRVVAGADVVAWVWWRSLTWWRRADVVARPWWMRVVDALFLRVAHCVIGVPACERRAT